ncbi:hypothetical protein [uncultured Sphingomonas sp.]|jgi:hypothetical protein|uniref:hypothetical protein n=1 Tax=uncultured Sphingomonas sp. TaxID=158754 RepID=UPI0030DA1EDE
MIEQIASAAAGMAGAVDSVFHDRAYLPALLGSTLTGLGVFFTGYQIRRSGKQYKIEQGWKRSEMVRSYLSQMTTDANMALALRVLDWRSGPAQIPQQFQPLFDVVEAQSTPPAWHAHAPAKGYFRIDWDRFVRSLEVMRDPEWDSADMFAYRTCFDSFCTFLQSVADDVRSISVTPAEYADLSFYCHRVLFPKNQLRHDDPAAGLKLREYIEHYYNKRTFRVMARIAEEYAKEHGDEFNIPSLKFPEFFPPEVPKERRARLAAGVRAAFNRIRTVS